MNSLIKEQYSMKIKKNLLYISDCFLKSSVFESQVHSLCNVHSQHFNVTLLVLCNKEEYDMEGLAGAKYKLVKYKKPPKLFMPLSQKIAMFTYKNITPFYQADVIHSRGQIGTGFAINICKKYNLQRPIIADIRGAMSEEITYMKSFGYKFFSAQANILEEFVFKNATYLFFVSENMKKFYETKYNFIIKSAIFPTIVNENFFYKSSSNRAKMREELSIEDKFVYIYVGNADKWQKLDIIMVEFMKQVSKNNLLYLVIVTTEPLKVKAMLLELNIDITNILITSTTYNKVAKYINAADAGLLIRDENSVNYVASPTKRNEYLACGIKVVDKLNEIGNTDYEAQNLHYKPFKEIIEEQEKIYKNLGQNNR